MSRVPGFGVASRCSGPHLDLTPSSASTLGIRIALSHVEMFRRIACHTCIPRHQLASLRLISNSRPSPPPLPQEQQREFEELQRLAQQPLLVRGTKADLEAELALHPDARKPVKAAFEGNVNPITGEQGGPKQEPVRRWSNEDEGDWSYKGRVSDF